MEVQPQRGAATRALPLLVRPTVFVVDDDVSVRESVQALVAASGFEAEGFASAEEFLALPRCGSPCCLVLDLGLPQLDGFSLQERLVSNHSDLPIIFITGNADIPRAVRAMKAGAIEFLPKPFGSAALLGAIERALEHSRRQLAQQISLRGVTRRFESLSRRERDVMVRVLLGRLNKQIAAELDISEITVKAHRGRVMRKMAVRSLAELVGLALQLGIHVGEAD